MKGQCVDITICIYTYLIIGSPIARASSFNVKSKSYPNYVLGTRHSDTSRLYRSVKERNPWLYVDYEDELHFDNVSIQTMNMDYEYGLINQIPFSLSQISYPIIIIQVTIKFNSSAYWQGAGHIEIRIGNEKIGQTFEKSLTTNNLCGRYVLSEVSRDNQISITCNTRLYGRYLSVQKKMKDQFTVLEIDEITYQPSPSKFNIIIQFLMQSKI